jgi:hypothetical protein
MPKISSFSVWCHAWQVERAMGKLILEIIRAAGSTSAIKEVPGYVPDMWRGGRAQGLHVVANDPFETSHLALQSSQRVCTAPEVPACEAPGSPVTSSEDDMWM